MEVKVQFSSWHEQCIFL